MKVSIVNYNAINIYVIFIYVWEKLYFIIYQLKYDCLF